MTQESAASGMHIDQRPSRYPYKAARAYQQSPGVSNHIGRSP